MKQSAETTPECGSRHCRQGGMCGRENSPVVGERKKRQKRHPIMGAGTAGGAGKRARTFTVSQWTSE